MFVPDPSSVPSKAALIRGLVTLLLVAALLVSLRVYFVVEHLSRDR